MKVFAVVLAVAVAVSAQLLTDQERAQLIAFRQECSTATGLGADTLESAKKGVFPEDPKLRDFLFCMAKKTGMLNEAGVLQLDVVKQKLGGRLEGTDLPKLAVACRPPDSQASSSEKFTHFVKCLYEQKQINLVV